MMEVELYNYHPWLELIFLEEICYFYILLIGNFDTVFFQNIIIPKLPVLKIYGIRMFILAWLGKEFIKLQFDI